MTEPAKYPIRLTGGQLRVIHETLAVILNDPEQRETLGMDAREWAMLDRGAAAITAALHDARRAESTPA